jgi:diaminopimelate epimerase
MAVIPFTKMQATGNDFVMIDNRDQMIAPKEFSELAQRISNRKFGVGSDGLILLEAEGDMLVMIYKNPDGSDAGMCGNGARCFVNFAQKLGFGNEIRFRVHENEYQGVLRGDQVIVHFPLKTEVVPLHINGEHMYQVYTNTEHIVCPVQPASLADEKMLINKGRTYRYHKKFAPAGTNVNFMSGVSSDTVELQTYERGVENLTLACGTGAIATALAWHHQNSLKAGEYQMTVKVQGGTLSVRFTFDSTTKKYQKISLAGPATIVFEGTYYC